MFKSWRFWFVIAISLIHVSFFTQIAGFFYHSNEFPERVVLAKSQFQKGVVLPLFALEEDYPYKQALDEISELGARGVSFFVTNFQEDIRTNTIYLNRRAAEPTQLAEMIDYAHSRGLSVFLFPTLHIQHLGNKEWRGVLQPSDPDLWWSNYSRVIRYYLQIAREHDVEMFSIGSELCSLEKEQERWNAIIRHARKNYGGLLTYSANWDHYQGITFIQDLDFMGVNAYFGLTRKDDPTLEELVDSWKPAKKRIEDVYHEYGKRIIFTEIGYPSVQGANRNPWNYFATTPADPDEQALCYQAFVKTWDPPPTYLHGIFFYNWWGQGGIGDRDYTPRDKPAEKILRTWYTSIR